MRFLVVAVGRGHPDWTAECLKSIEEQTENMRVCVVDDASLDGNEKVVAEVADRNGWMAMLNEYRHWALSNQVRAWKALEPEDDDVIVFVDLDDRIIRADALTIVRGYYEAGAWMTYGSYVPFPQNHPDASTCRPASAYSPLVTKARAYRKVVQQFNHLRTVSWKLLKHVSEADLRDDDGEFWRANTDRAVMWPCLEMAGPRAVFIPDVLYEYRCDSQDAIWRSQLPRLLSENDQLRRRPPKRELP